MQDETQTMQRQELLTTCCPVRPIGVLRALQTSANTLRDDRMPGRIAARQAFRARHACRPVYAGTDRIRLRAEAIPGRDSRRSPGHTMLPGPFDASRR